MPYITQRVVSLVIKFNIADSVSPSYKAMTGQASQLKWFLKLKKVCKKLLYVGAMAIIAVVPSTQGYAAPTFTSYPTTTTFTQPGDVVSAGGALWYMESTTPASPSTHIARVNTSGLVTDYDIATLSSKPNLQIVSIATGIDGNVWFNAYSSNSILVGYLNVSTGTVATYSGGGLSYSYPGKITTGPDGNLWYFFKNASNGYHSLVRVSSTTGTAAITYSSGDSNSNYNSLAFGTDGRLWAIETHYKRLFAFNAPAGTYSTFYSLPSGASSATGITYGPDGNLWFSSSSSIFKATTSGVFTEYPLASGSTPLSLTSGPDGAIWFINGLKITCFTTSGSVTDYAIPGSSVSATDLVVGPDDALWFTYRDNGVGKVGRLGY